jgi:hypothetical protein
MTKDELAANGYNIDKSYQVLMPFMRPHDSQLDYYERSRTIMNIITERHQATGGTILLVARKFHNLRIDSSTFLFIQMLQVLKV